MFANAYFLPGHHELALFACFESVSASKDELVNQFDVLVGWERGVVGFEHENIAVEIVGEGFLFADGVRGGVFVGSIGDGSLDHLERKRN